MVVWIFYPAATNVVGSEGGNGISGNCFVVGSKKAGLWGVTDHEFKQQLFQWLEF
jgi:hypothetical protein